MRRILLGGLLATVVALVWLRLPPGLAADAVLVAVTVAAAAASLRAWRRSPQRGLWSVLVVLMATLALSMTTTVFAGAPAWLWIREALQMTALTYSAFFVFAASRTPDRPASAPFPLDVLVGLVGLYLAAWVLLDSNGTSTPTALTVHRAAGALLTVVAMVWLVQLVRRLPARRSNPPWVGAPSPRAC